MKLNFIPAFCYSREIVGFRSISYYQNIEIRDYQGGVMANHFVKFTDSGMLDDIATRSRERPVVIFKHSLTCPISAAAYAEMLAFDGDVALLEVQRSRELSREVEDRLGVAHESPQVIILKNGQVVWNASHFSITAAAVADAIRELAAGEQ